jgi:hypothetical protein
MKWFSSIWMRHSCWKHHHSWHGFFCCTPANLTTKSSPKNDMVDTDVPPGAGCTLKHHSLDPCGGHEMV